MQTKLKHAKIKLKDRINKDREPRIQWLELLPPNHCDNFNRIKRNVMYILKKKKKKEKCYVTYVYNFFTINLMY